MHRSTEKSLLSLGFDTSLIAKIGGQAHTVSMLRPMNREQLRKHYTDDETDQILQKVRRPEIPAATVESLLTRSGACCCVCADGNSTRPYQIHHATPYSETQDHSEDNLILLCPTHHATVHAAEWLREEQVRLRERWYALRELAAPATAKGVSFPYAALDFLDYRPAPNFGDLVELAPLTASTAAACCPPALAGSGINWLQTERYLVVIGESGSGKSSFAQGVAGQYASKIGAQVFRFMRQQKDGEPMKELSIALTTCATPTIFIVDDANQWASADSIEKLRQLVRTSSVAHLIVTLSPDDSGTAEALSRPHQDYLWINWQTLRESVTVNIQTHEDAVIARLAELKGKADHPIGHGQMERQLYDAVEEAAASAHSVYDFIFKLRDPRAGARAAAVELSAKDAGHQPILIAAINQIAGFEQAMDPEEVVTVCRQLPARPGVPAAGVEWVESMFRQAVRRRHAIAVRGAYTTVHRRWAAEFIDECFALPATAADAEFILRREFLLEPANSARLFRLWSWLENKKAAGEFVHLWIRGLSKTDRIKWAGHCMQGGLGSMGWFAHSLWFLYSDAEWKNVTKETFEGQETLITQAVMGATAKDWYGLRELMNALHHTAPDLTRRVLAAWTPDRAAKLISTSPTAAYDSIQWMLGGAVIKVDQPWCVAVGARLSWEEIRAQLTVVKKGAAGEVNDVLEVLSSCRVKLMRSMVRDLMQALAQTLSGVSLADLRVDFAIGPLWIMFVLFPEEARKAVSGVDTKRWAWEIEHSRPRLWRKLTDFVMFCEPAAAPVLSAVFDQVDRAKILQILSKYAPTYPYEFRTLLYLLSYLDRAQQTAWATDLLPLVTGVVAAKATESQPILSAFHRLDPTAAQALAAKYGIELKSNQRHDFNLYFPEARAEYARRDERREEYDTEILQWDDSKEKPPRDST